MMSRVRERIPHSVLLFIPAVAAVAYATLRPVVQAASTDPFCIFCGDRGGADFLSNVALFGPLGVALAARGHGIRRALLGGFALSLAIELAQVSLVAGRDATVGDLLANTLGTGAGWALLHWLWLDPPRERRRAVRAALLAAVGALVVLLGSLSLFRPAAPEETFYLQWTAEFGNMDRYLGRVLGTRLGALDFSADGRMPDSEAFARAYEAESTLDVLMAAGPRPPGLAPLVSVYDSRQKEVFLLGVERDNLVLRYRTLGAGLKLDRRFVRFPGILRGTSVGDSVRIVIALETGRICAEAVGRRICRVQPAAGGTWLLLRDGRAFTDRERVLPSMFWVAVLLVPAGLLAPGLRVAALIGGAVAAALLALPVALGLPPTPAEQLLAALCGVVLGGALGKVRSAPARSRQDEEDGAGVRS